MIDEKQFDAIIQKHLKNGKLDRVSAIEELDAAFGIREKGKWTWQIRKWLENNKQLVENSRFVKQLKEIRDVDIVSLANQKAFVDTIAKNFNISRYEVIGRVTEINEQGIYNIQIINDRLMLNKQVLRNTKKYVHAVGVERHFKFLVMGDTHLCGIYEQLSFVHYLYDYAKSLGITNVYHVGDISDGYYRNRPDHIYGLHKIGFDEQAEYIARNYPKREGMTTYFITGDHDETRIKNGGADIGKKLSAMREDLIYLGVGSAMIQLTPNCNMQLFHPLDGSSYAVSYSGQKYMDSLSGGDKPNLIFTGHHHKGMYFIYRNIHYFEVPSTCLQSSWEKRLKLNNVSGAWIVELDIDEDGSVTHLKAEQIPHYKKIIDDYKNFQ